MTNNKIILIMSDTREHEGEFIVSGKEANAIRTLLDGLTLPSLPKTQKHIDEIGGCEHIQMQGNIR
jgi:hypothetical protein